MASLRQLLIPNGSLGINFGFTHPKGPLDIEASCKAKKDSEVNPKLLPSQKIECDDDVFSKNVKGKKE